MNNTIFMAHPDGIQSITDRELAEMPLPKSKNKRPVEPEAETKIVVKMIRYVEINDKINFNVQIFNKHRYSELELRYSQAEEVLQIIGKVVVDRLTFTGELELSHMPHVEKLIKNFNDLKTVEFKVGSIGNFGLIKLLENTNINKLVMNRLLDVELTTYIETFKSIPNLIDFNIMPGDYEAGPDTKKMDLIDEFFRIRKIKQKQEREITEFQKKLTDQKVTINPF